MPAQNFQTAEALGITDAELDALIKVLGMLEREECEDFCMATVDHLCGSPSCTLGWARHVAGERIFPFVGGEKGKPIYDLFFPNNLALYSRDQGMCAIALRSYLTTGEPRWSEALAA